VIYEPRGSAEGNRRGAQERQLWQSLLLALEWQEWAVFANCCGVISDLGPDLYQESLFEL